MDSFRGFILRKKILDLEILMPSRRKIVKNLIEIPVG
jgi:hypothetical protein